MQKNTSYSYGSLLEILKQELPVCFKRAGLKQPLKIDIHQDIIAYYSQDKRFTPKTLCRAIGFYTKGKAYLRTLQEGANRIDLEGKAVGKVTKQQADYAKKFLNAKQIISRQKNIKKPNKNKPKNKLSLTNNAYLKPSQASSTPYSSNVTHNQQSQTQQNFNTTIIATDTVNVQNVANSVNNLKKVVKKISSIEREIAVAKKSRWPTLSLNKLPKVTS